jgi:hypothetical protein
LGNGISIIIFAGIVATAPTSFLQLMQNTTGAYRLYNIVMFILITLISLVVIILIQEGVRRIPVNVWQARAWAKDVWWAIFLHPAQDQPCWDDPAHLRPIHDYLPCYLGEPVACE